MALAYKTSQFKGIKLISKKHGTQKPFFPSNFSQRCLKGLRWIPLTWNSNNLNESYIISSIILVSSHRIISGGKRPLLEIGQFAIGPFLPASFVIEDRFCNISRLVIVDNVAFLVVLVMVISAWGTGLIRTSWCATHVRWFDRCANHYLWVMAVKRFNKFFLGFKLVQKRFGNCDTRNARTKRQTSSAQC